MCAEEAKESCCKTESKGTASCLEKFAGMFESMHELCGCGDKPSDCRDKMKTMMSKCCGEGAAPPSS